MSQYFSKPYEPFGGDINVKVNLSNYETKADIKNISHIDTSTFSLKSNLAGFKTEADKLNIDNVVPISVDLSELSDVVKNDVFKKAVHNKLVAKVNRIDIGGLVKETECNAKITETEDRIPTISC